VLIADRYRGTAFQGDEPGYPSEQVELVSDIRLRAGLGLADGDPISFAVVAEPGGNALSS
jgi:CTP-dependent riboflavin kinase